MASITSGHRRAHRLIALLLGLVAVAPVPSVAASPGLLLADGPAAARVSRASLDGWVDERRGAQGAASRGAEPGWRIDARIAELDALVAAENAARQLAAAAEARAAAEAAAAQAAAEAAARAAAPKAAAPAYSGRNHVWIPSLGVSRAVESFSCSRSTPPANRVYRWGCAGTNNVYLFGHAWGVMKPVHDAYVAGRLKKGMVVVYADGGGRVRTYRVTEVRVVTPDQVDWAIAAQSRPSMTLQTCVGANGEKRLLVRLVGDG